MKKIKLKLLSLMLIPITLLLNHLFSIYRYTSESLYSLNLNKVFIQALSKLTGFLPFALSEIILYILILMCSYYFLRTLWHIFDHKSSRIIILFHFILDTSVAFSVVYFLFMTMWGFNYLRPRFGENTGIYISHHTTAELAELYAYLIEETNKLSEKTLKDAEGNMIIPQGYQSVFARASLGYSKAAVEFPNLGGDYGRPKPILMSRLMNYTGIAGIYFPFTGEPNVNVALLDMAIPSTTMHEMAHQRGYANEDECNFIAFLTCSLHPDADFKYSGYLLALAHASSALARDNIELLKQLNQNLSPSVLQDIRNSNAFWKQYQGAVEVLSNKVNDTYLKANGISDGEKSYGRMVDLLLGYYTLTVKQ